MRLDQVYCAWLKRGLLCLYTLQKVDIWTGVTDAWLTDSQRKDRATQLLIKYKSGALVTQYLSNLMCYLPQEQALRVLFHHGQSLEVLSSGDQISTHILRQLCLCFPPPVFYFCISLMLWFVFLYCCVVFVLLHVFFVFLCYQPVIRS